MSRLAWTRWPLGGYYLFGGTHLFRFLLGLRDRLRVIEEKRGDLLKCLLADVHRAVDAIAWLQPIHFAHRHLPCLSFSAIAELDVEYIPAQDYRHPMKGIAMPRCRLPRRQPESPDQVISVMVQQLLMS